MTSARNREEFVKVLNERGYSQRIKLLNGETIDKDLKYGEKFRQSNPSDFEEDYILKIVTVKDKSNLWIIIILCVR
jgi:hypothetical protein